MDRCYYLPEHVLLDILIYLPVMSLLRFKAVCKHWCSLIESPAFISEHVAHNRDNNEEDDLIALGRFWDPRPRKSRFALLSGSQYEECVYDIDNGMFWYPTLGSVTLVCCCDGIVCLEYLGEIALWNPALKQVKRMPPPLFSDKLLEGINVCYASFGVDLKSNDYKMVNILIEYWDGMEHRVVGNQVEVYNLRGDDSWRIICKDEVLPFHDIYTLDAASSSKTGMCFWLASYDETTVLLSFDFSDDVFRTTRFPDDGRFPAVPNIDLLDGKAVCMLQKSNGVFADDKFLDIWMLHEFGVEESWNLIYKLGPFLRFLDRISPRFSKSGEFLICSKSYAGVQNRLYMYNLHTQQGNFIQSCCFEATKQGSLVRYSASLVSLKKTSTDKLPLKLWIVWYTRILHLVNTHCSSPRGLTVVLRK